MNEKLKALNDMMAKTSSPVVQEEVLHSASAVEETHHLDDGMMEATPKPEVIIEKPFLVADELFLNDFQVGDLIIMRPLTHTVARTNKAKVLEVSVGPKNNLLEIHYDSGVVTWCEPRAVQAIQKRVTSKK